MIHYHGTPITPRAKLLELAGRCFCVRYGGADRKVHRDLEVCHEIGQSVMLDNGAFSFWRAGDQTDWDGYVKWVRPWLDYHTTWCVIPDVIDGTEQDNDDLIIWWWSVVGQRRGCYPVWHLHESFRRLWTLCHNFDRVCIGSSGQYADVGTPQWHRRMEQVFDELCRVGGRPPVWIHMLRGLSQAGGPYPFASADSTWIAQNHAGNNTRMTPARDVKRMAEEMDGRQCPSAWRPTPHQLAMEA